MGELKRTIAYAHVRCMTTSELIEELAKYPLGDSIDACLSSLAERKLTKTDAIQLGMTIDAVLNNYEHHPAKYKKKIEGFVCKLINHLPAEYTDKYFSKFIGSTRRSGRNIAYRSLFTEDRMAEHLRKSRRNRALSLEEFTKLFSTYNKKRDSDALKVILINGQYLSLEQVLGIMDSIKDRYWTARLIEAAIANKVGIPSDFRDQFPFELTHAIGRLADKKFKDDLTYMFEANKTDIEFLSIYTLGKIRDKKGLKILEKYVKIGFQIKWQQQIISNYDKKVTADIDRSVTKLCLVKQITH